MRPAEALNVLGLPESATPTEIKAAYRRLVKAWHPDRHAGDPKRRARAEESLKRIIEAYQCVRQGVPAPERAPSAFSVRPTAPAAAWRNRDSPRTRAATRAHRTLRPAIEWTSLVLLLALLGSTGAWLLIRSLKLQEEPGGQATTGRVAAKASRVGRTWNVQNPTQQAWSRCRAWVGPKSIVVPELRPGASVSLSAHAFDPPLGELDDGTQLELFCAWK